MTQAASGVEQARANLAAAEAAAATAQSLVRQAEADVLTEKANTSQARADVAAAEADQTQAEQDLKRYRDLIGEGAVSQQQLDQQATNEKTARSRLASAREKVASAQAKVVAAEAKRRAVQDQMLQAETQVKAVQAAIGEATGKLESASSAPNQVAVSRSQEASMKAQYEQAKAQLAAAQLDLSYTQIPAPEAGLVTRKSAEPGAYVQVGQALMAIVPTSVWVIANFKETQLTHMRPGQSVKIEVDAYPGVKFRGKVDSIQAGTGARFSLLPPENASGNYVKVVQRVPVKIVFDGPPDPSHLLAPGMSVIPSVKVR
jgi:membrane fusion protein (multidrug efflux system)